MSRLARPTRRLITLAVAGSVLFLSAGVAPAGADVTFPLDSPSFESTGTEMVAYNGYLYFAANDGTRGNELWRTDGTVAGTAIVADLDTNGIHSNPYRLTVADGRLFFNVTGGGGADLYVYDGSGAPQRITVEANGSVGYIMGSVGSTLLAVGYINHHIVQGRHVVRAVASGATNATVVDGGAITPDSTGSRSSFSTETGGWLYFWGSNSVGSGPGAGLGAELYRTNGATTELVKDIGGPGTAGAPHDLTTVGNLVFFTAVTAASNRELWRTDGTDAGTFMVKEHVPGSGAPAFHDFAAHGGNLYYSVSEPVLGHELWTSDGTTAGTRVVKDIVPGTQGSGPAQLTSAGARLYFRTSAGAWVTDGTDAGTVQLAQPAGDGYGVQLLTPFGSNLYFRAGANPGGSMVWRSNGTPAGTIPLSAGAYEGNRAAGNAAVGAIGVLGHKVIFTSRFPGDPARQAWVRLNVLDTTLPDPAVSDTPPTGTQPPGTGPSPTKPAKLTVRKKPTIKGTARVGAKLTVRAPKFKQKGVKITYRWLANGKAIKKATKRTFRITAKQKGKRISVRITATKKGFARTVVTSAATKKVADRRR